MYAYVHARIRVYAAPECPEKGNYSGVAVFLLPPERGKGLALMLV
jgi:hypothetical protein